MGLTRYPAFCGGSYTTQNPLLQARTINFLPEQVDVPGAAARIILNPTPGVEIATTVPKVPHRGFYEYNGRVFFVSGNGLYELFGDFSYTLLGEVLNDDAPVSMQANGEAGRQLQITAGGACYILNLDTNALTTVMPTGATMGAMLDGFFLTIDRVSSQFQTSRLLDGLDRSIAAVPRSAAPDPWQAFAVYEKIIALQGRQTTEFWYNAGLAPFPFTPIPNALIPFGIHAVRSNAVVGSSLCFLASTSTQVNEVIRLNGTSPEIIGTPELHWAMANYPRTDDAIGFTDGYLGRMFYGLCFPTARATWVYDLTSKLWHEEGTWLSEEARYDAVRPLHRCFGFGTQIVGDRTSGAIYRRSPLYSLDVDQRPIRRVRRPPFLYNNGLYMTFNQFELVLEAGLGAANAFPLFTGGGINGAVIDHLAINAGEGNSATPSTDPQINLHRSDDGGKSWWTRGLRSAGAQGEYTMRPIWEMCGATDNFAGFEVVMSAPVPWRIVDALIDLELERR